MDASQLNSINSVSSAASARVATSMAPKPSQASAKDATQNNATSSSSSSSSATITANDFLTLLVSELQNQDPTQPTDPDSYIQQLVGVNSLQQLVSINQGISTLDSGVASASATSSS